MTTDTESPEGPARGAAGKTTRHRARVAGLAFLLPFSIYLALPAATVNGDGLGYYYCAQGHDWSAKFLPGHLVFCPLMTVVGRVAEAAHPGATRHAMVLVDQLAAAAAALWLFGTARALGIGPFGQWMAALGLAFSYGVWIEAIDIETYAPALLSVVGSLSQMVWYARTGRQRHLALLGALNGIAGLLHIATVALVPASAALILLRERSGWRRLGTALLVYAAALLLFLVIPVLAIGFGFLGLTTAAEILPWLTSSRHGYRVVVNALSIPRAAYGLARTFVFLEFFWAAPKWVIALKGAVFLAVAAWAIRHIRPVWGRLDPPARSVRRAVLLFVALQAALGAYFFGSDTERWVFIAPLLWLALADAVSLASASQQRLAALIVGAMFTVNLVQGIWPAATDRSTEARVRALAEILPGKAVVVITPGEDWLGYYHYFTGERLDRLDLLDVAMRTRDDHAAFYAEIERRIDRAREAAGTVLMIRVIDPSENYRVSAWQALAAFGYQPPQVREWFGRYRWDEMRLNDPAHTRVYRLRAPAPPAPPEHG